MEQIPNDEERDSQGWLDDDKPHDQCGVFGIYGHPEAAKLTYLGLHSLQHRGPGIGRYLHHG